MRFSIKNLLNIAGVLLSLTGILFVVMRFMEYADQLELERFDTTAWIYVSLLAFVYGASNIFLARSWWHLLRFLDVLTVWKWALKVYGLSQLAKYVPGNIFHFAGRQAYGLAAGLSGRLLLKSTLWELGLISVCGVFFGILVAPMVFVGVAIWVPPILFVITTFVLGCLLRNYFSLSLFMAMLWQVIFLAISGFIFVGTLTLVVSEAGTMPGVTYLCGAYVVAWLAGLVTPGAPAGLGVRELVLFFLVDGLVAEADLLVAILLCRLVTVVGDSLFFIVATILKSTAAPLFPKAGEASH